MLSRIPRIAVGTTILLALSVGQAFAQGQIPVISDLCTIDGKPFFMQVTADIDWYNGTVTTYVNTSGQLIRIDDNGYVNNTQVTVSVVATLDPAPTCN